MAGKDVPLGFTVLPIYWYSQTTNVQCCARDVSSSGPGMKKHSWSLCILLVIHYTPEIIKSTLYLSPRSRRQRGEGPGWLPDFVAILEMGDYSKCVAERRAHLCLREICVSGATWFSCYAL